MAGAYETGVYRNIFKECGYSEEEIEKRVKETFETIFYGSEEERFYHEAGADMGYMEDTGNHDVRTEGMSYGMMVCVQMNRKQEFDRLWKWVRTYMYIEDGPGKNYFVWSCAVDGTRNADGPAPDGEEYFAMALFFASKRWGDGEGIFNYSSEARAILRECVHKGEPGHPGEPMWNPENHLIKFVTSFEFSDPSYHLPHFYELFALWADPCDHEFWKKAADASENIFTRHVTSELDYLRNMQIMTEHRMHSIRRFSAVMTGTTAMHIVRLPISEWIISGLTRIPGRRKMPISCSNFTVKNRRNTGMGYF